MHFQLVVSWTRGTSGCKSLFFTYSCLTCFIKTTYSIFILNTWLILKMPDIVIVLYKNISWHMTINKNNKNCLHNNWVKHTRYDCFWMCHISSCFWIKESAHSLDDQMTCTSIWNPQDRGHILRVVCGRSVTSVPLLTRVSQHTATPPSLWNYDTQVWTLSWA